MFGELLAIAYHITTIRPNFDGILNQSLVGLNYILIDQKRATFFILSYILAFFTYAWGTIKFIDNQQNRSVSIVGKIVLFLIYLLQTISSILLKVSVLALKNKFSIIAPWGVIGSCVFMKIMLFINYPNNISGKKNIPTYQLKYFCDVINVSVDLSKK